MADILNLPNCGGSTSTFNSGFALCDVIRQEPKILILIDSGLEFNDAARATIAAFVAKMKEYTRGVRGARAYPIMQLTNFEDTSTAPTKAAVGNLSIQQITMQEGVPSFAFQHRKGDLFHQQLSRAENANLKLLIVDAAYVVYGTKTSGGNFTGFTMAEFYAELAKFATASEPSKYPFNVTLDSITEYKENLGFIQLDSTVLNISGIVDVDLNTVGAPPVQVAGVMKIAPIGRGGKNIGLTFPTELADVDAWKITNDQTDASVTVATATWDAALQMFIVTGDPTAYTALTPGQTWSIDLVDTAALLDLGVDGYESLGPVTLTKP